MTPLLLGVGPHVDMIVSKGWLNYVIYLEPEGLSIMNKSFVWSCLGYGHLLYFGADLNLLDALQHQAVGICLCTFPCQHAAVIGFTCQLLDGEGHGDLQSFIPPLNKSFLVYPRLLYYHHFCFCCILMTSLLVSIIKVKLCADDILLCSYIHSESDCIALQQDSVNGLILG